MRNTRHSCVSLIIVVLFTVTFTPLRGQTLEAEDGALSGTEISTQRGGYSGAGYVTGFDADGDKVSFTFNAEKGVYDLYVRYAAPSGDKFNFVYVNGQNMGSLAFPQAASFSERRIGRIFLQQGSNTLAIVKEWGYFDLDNVRITASAPAEILNVAANLVTPAPSARALMTPRRAESAPQSQDA